MRRLRHGASGCAALRGVSRSAGAAPSTPGCAQARGCGTEGAWVCAGAGVRPRALLGVRRLKCKDREGVGVRRACRGAHSRFKIKSHFVWLLSASQRPRSLVRAAVRAAVSGVAFRRIPSHSGEASGVGAPHAERATARPLMLVCDAANRGSSGCIVKACDLSYRHQHSGEVTRSLRARASPAARPPHSQECSVLTPQAPHAREPRGAASARREPRGTPCSHPGVPHTREPRRAASAPRSQSIKKTMQAQPLRLSCL